VITQILVAVDDSPASRAAAKLAVYLAAGLGARLRVVHVAVDHELAEALAAATPRSQVPGRVARGREALLTRMSGLATAAGVEVAALLLDGDVVPAVLRDARACGADLVVIGRSARSRHGDPYVGSQARALLELSDVPVVVVPAPGL
jgi:nucleotide-binding universal stress UspA family protein